MADNAAHFAKQLLKCRVIASGCIDAKLRAGLLELAAEYER